MSDNLKKIYTQLSLKDGMNSSHYAVIAVIFMLVVGVFSLGGNKDSIRIHASDMVTPAVLKAIYTQNLKRPDEYAESMPIIKSMEKHLYQFELGFKEYPDKANASLLVVRTRFAYLRHKGLDVSEAKALLDDYIRKNTQ